MKNKFGIFNLFTYLYINKQSKIMQELLDNIEQELAEERLEQEISQSIAVVSKQYPLSKFKSTVIEYGKRNVNTIPLLDNNDIDDWGEAYKEYIKFIMYNELTNYDPKQWVRHG